jgi:hypothetical protein
MRRVILTTTFLLAFLVGIGLGQNYENLIGGAGRLVFVAGGQRQWEILSTGALQPAPGVTASIALPDLAVGTADIAASAVTNAKLGSDVGQWTDVTFSAGDFVGTGCTWTVAAGDVTYFKYAIVGNVMYAYGVLVTTTTNNANCSVLNITIPAGKSAPVASDTFMRYVDNGTIGLGWCSPTGTTMRMYTATTANWSAATDNTSIRFSCVFPIS